jgi:hypothetical protein
MKAFQHRRVPTTKKCNLLFTVLSMYAEDPWRRLNKGYAFRLIESGAGNVQIAIAGRFVSLECIKGEILSGDGLCDL